MTRDCQQEGETDAEDHRHGGGDEDCNPETLATNDGKGDDKGSCVDEDGTGRKHEKRLV